MLAWSVPRAEMALFLVQSCADGKSRNPVREPRTLFILQIGETVGLGLEE
jgi:hypothetical protein